MMVQDSLFKQYATSTAFQVSLSNSMVQLLLALDYAKNDGHSYLSIAGIHNTSTGQALIRRGLIDHSIKPGEKARYTLTEAGRLTIPMLKLAGYDYMEMIGLGHVDWDDIEEIEPPTVELIQPGASE